jgi:hypothetical protein
VYPSSPFSGASPDGWAEEDRPPALAGEQALLALLRFGAKLSTSESGELVYWIEHGSD